MKKLILVLMAFILALSSAAVLANDKDYEITSSGEITAYYGTEYVVIPETVNGIPVVKIGDEAFFDLGIDDVYIPEGLSEIGKSAFEGSNVKSVEIPSTVSVIGDRAFANCKGLKTVFACIDENTVIGEDAFAGTSGVLFYIDCDVDTKAIERKLLLANGGVLNFGVEIRHVSADYDDYGNVICGACGFAEMDVAGGIPFSDVPYDSWYYDYVKSAYHNNIINGKSENIFDPEATMTCAEAVKIAACIKAIFGEPVGEYTSGPWYQPYVDYCYKYGIIEDYIVFDWNKPVTRAQMAYIFSHCDPFDDWFVDINDVPHTDIPDVVDSTPFAYEIRRLYNKGIAVGDENMRFYPDSDIRRCEAAAIVSRIMGWHTRVELPKG